MARVTEEMKKDIQNSADQLMKASNSFGALRYAGTPNSPSNNIDDSMDDQSESQIELHF